MEHTILAKAVINSVEKDLGVDGDAAIAFLSDDVILITGGV